MREKIEQQPVDRVKWIPRNRLRANDYNPNHVPPLELQLLKTSILESGWTQPIVVAPDGITIIDGFHRWTVAADPKIAVLTNGQVPVVVCDHEEPIQQMAASIRHNRARGEHAVRPLITVVQQLLKHLPREEVMRVLGMQGEEVDRLSLLRASTDIHGEADTKLSEAWLPEGPPPVMRE